MYLVVKKTRKYKRCHNRDVVGILFLKIRGFIASSIVDGESCLRQLCLSQQNYCGNSVYVLKQNPQVIFRCFKVFWSYRESKIQSLILRIEKRQITNEYYT